MIHNHAKLDEYIIQVLLYRDHYISLTPYITSMFPQGVTAVVAMGYGVSKIKPLY